MMGRWERIEEEVEETEKPRESTQVHSRWRPSQETIEAIQGTKDAPTEHEPKQREFQDVPVRQVDAHDMMHVQGPDDFHKVSYDEVVEGFRKLNTVVRPAVENGEGGDYFRELDKQNELDYAQGYGRVYDAF